MGNYSPLVSVIIPNYNHAKYLEQRILSVLNQTYPNFEVIILDDKSSDNSEQIINRFRENQKVSHIVINKENSGSTFIQWNKGFDLAKGELIWIAESDDYCEPNFLEKCVNEFKQDGGIAVVYTASQYVNEFNENLPTYNPYKSPKYYYSGKEFIKSRMDFGCAIWNASSAVFKRDIALSIYKDYQEFKACGDKLFWIYMAEKGDVVYVNEALNYFRQHENKVSPRKFRDGTSLKEEKKIFNYQVKKGYLKGLKKINALNLYKTKIQTSDFENEHVREELISLWQFNTDYKTKLISLMARIYQYYHIHIKKNLNK